GGIQRSLAYPSDEQRTGKPSAGRPPRRPLDRVDRLGGRAKADPWPDIFHPCLASSPPVGPGTPATRSGTILPRSRSEVSKGRPMRRNRRRLILLGLLGLGLAVGIPAAMWVS